jgi:hypothetical protein
MKIKINAILRGPDFCADPDDEREVENSFGAKLIEAGAATLIVEKITETMQLIEEVKTIEIEETEPVDGYKTFKKKGR